MIRVRSLVLCLLALPQFAISATPDELDRLYDALNAPELMRILSEEGMMQSQELRDDMFPGRGAGSWNVTTSAIYNIEDMTAAFRASFDKELAEEDITDLLAFFEGVPGAEIVQLEVEARRALMNEDVEDAAREAFVKLEAENPDRVSQLTEFARANNLIDLNASGALNANLAFYRGLAAGGGFEMPEDEILTDVWKSADDIRADTTEWIFGYMTLAYGPVGDDDLAAYIAISETLSGRALNRALFTAYDDLFRGISFRIGEAASKFAQGDDI